MLQIIYDSILFPWLVLAIISFIFLFKVNAPYGKFSNNGWGKLFNYKIGWFIQEIVSPITFSYFFITGAADKNIISWILFSIWVGHYINRSIIFPIRLSNAKSIPASVIVSAIFFNLINGFINGFYLGNLAFFDSNYIVSLIQDFKLSFQSSLDRKEFIKKIKEHRKVIIKNIIETFLNEYHLRVSLLRLILKAGALSGSHPQLGEPDVHQTRLKWLQLNELSKVRSPCLLS